MRRKIFANPHLENTKRSIWDFLLWKLGYYKDLENQKPQPENFSYPASPKKFIRGEPTAVWIGHSSYLLEIAGTYILTDPVFSEYCSPFPISSLKRRSPPPISLKELPPIDLVLISHNHYDHLDKKTVLYLKKHHPKVEWIIPEALSPWFRKKSIHQVTELSWWNSTTKVGAKISAVPSQHFSGRTLLDINRTHWNGYILEKGGKKLYFSGDTGYNSKDFKQIGERFGPVDLSLLPIGTYVPSAFMKPVHICPYEAVKIHMDVGSRLSLGMHWNTFQLSEEPLNRPPYDLYLAMKEKNLPFESFLPIEIGAHVNF